MRGIEGSAQVVSGPVGDIKESVHVVEGFRAGCHGVPHNEFTIPQDAAAGDDENASHVSNFFVTIPIPQGVC